MKIDISKSAAENIWMLMMDANPTASSVTMDKITVGSVTALSGDASGKNSQVTITAQKNKGYSQTVSLKFNRLTVDKGVPSLPTAISINPGDTQLQRQTKIAQALGLILSEVTITGPGGASIGTPANEDDTSVSALITPNANSSLYAGNPLTIQLTTPDVDVPLPSVITVTVMNGFDPA